MERLPSPTLTPLGLPLSTAPSSTPITITFLPPSYLPLPLPPPHHRHLHSISPSVPPFTTISSTDCPSDHTTTHRRPQIQRVLDLWGPPRSPTHSIGGRTRCTPVKGLAIQLKHLDRSVSHPPRQPEHTHRSRPLSFYHMSR